VNASNKEAHPIADSYWVRPGLLLAGEYPGAHDAAEARKKLGVLLDAGVRQFIDLTETGEYSLHPYWPLVQQLAAERAIAVAHRRLAIPDMGTPEPAHMLTILDAIDEAVAAQRPVYVHCFGGIGRTGTVVGCYLVRRGAGAEAALAEIEQRRRGTPDGYRESPETAEQRRFVRSWREPGV
jgi:protein-tyrosine phosphatase